ncbi:MAG: alpha/beta hydrolase, partial [Dehalococcoidia bacterium]|nr:alpha/beta hydrolase [Dehalococcoidia bacterium]
GGASAPQHEWLDLSVEERVARTLATFDVRQDAAWQAANPAVVAAMVQQLSQPPSWDDDPRRELGFRQQMMARKGHDTFDRLPSVTAPTLICGGVYDGVAPPANQEAMARRIPNARLEIFDGGHGFLGQDPRAYDVIRAFLQEEP